MKKLLLTFLGGVLCSLGMYAAAITPVYKDFTGLGTNVVYVASHSNITETKTTSIIASVAASEKWLAGYENEAWTGDNITERTLGINPDTDESMSGKLMGGRMKNASPKELQRSYWFYVTGVSAIWLYHEANNSRSTVVNVFEKDVTTAVFSTTTTDKTIKATGLDTSKKYIIKVNGNGSDVYFYAAKFFGTASSKEVSNFKLTSSNNLFLDINDNSTIITENNAGTVTYKSNNTSIATVSDAGKITAVGGGTTTISISDPGSSTVDGRNLTVTVNTFYAVDPSASLFMFDNAGYFLANNGKWHFKNGLDISTDQGFQYAALECNNLTNNGFKASAGKTYTINVPAGVTIRSAKVTMRSNYGNDRTAANWGTIFGQDLSSESLPYSNEDAVTKEFDITNETPLTFTPGGNQCQMYIELSTVALKQNSDFTISKNTVEIEKSKTTTVSYTTSSTGAVTATSSKESVATAVVDGNNIVITGVAAGSATITVSQEADATYKAGEKTITITVTDPTADEVVYNWNTVGTTTPAGSATTGTVKVKNVDTNGIKFGNGLSATNYLKIESANGGFKAGDVVTWTGCISNPDASKQGAIMIVSDAADGNVQLACSELFNNTNTTTVEASTGSFTLTEDAECLYIGRATSGISNATATWLTQLTVSRAATIAEATLNAKGYSTFSAAYPVKISGAKAYKATINAEGDKLVCTEIENGLVPAGEGVLLFGEAGAAVTAYYNASAPVVSDNELKATTLADGSLAAKVDALVLSGNTFLPYNGAAFAANKAYLPMPAGAKGGFSIVFDEDNTTAAAGVAEAKAEVKTVKLMTKDGLLIKNANGIVNAAGAQVK